MIRYTRNATRVIVFVDTKTGKANDAWITESGETLFPALRYRNGVIERWSAEKEEYVENKSLMPYKTFDGNSHGRWGESRLAKAEAWYKSMKESQQLVTSKG